MQKFKEYLVDDLKAKKETKTFQNTILKPNAL
jgi:hypothetical protein